MLSNAWLIVFFAYNWYNLSFDVQFIFSLNRDLDFNSEYIVLVDILGYDNEYMDKKMMRMILMFIQHK